MFLKFIQKSKERLSSKMMKWFVMGNEAADLDSVVCSLVYAYYKQEILGDTFAVIPICCIPLSQLTLKKDVSQWLHRFNIDPLSDLVYLEDINDLVHRNETEDNIQITLVDHHKPQPTVNVSHIREVIDHRISVYHYPEGQLYLNNIDLVGSCATLIALYIIAKSELKDYSTLLSMLRGVILLDTDCLAKDNGKTTKKDICTVETIEKYLTSTVDTRLDIYNLLYTAKSDVSGYSLTMMVKRDLKTLEFCWNETIVKMAIPAFISMDIENLLAIDDLKAQLQDIMKDLGVEIIIGLTCGTSLRHRRGYLMFSNNCQLNTGIYEYLLKAEHHLELHPFSIKDDIKVFYQNDTLTSRKKFIPILESFFNNKKQFDDQCNNCNVSISHQCFKTYDADIVIEIDEVEGAPYTLNTPLRSYSASPDNRISEMSLPSLNNRYTLQLVDKKRQKHDAEMDAEVYGDENIQEIEIINNDDKSPSAFTPENSDDESIDDKISDSNDNIGPLPLLKQSFSDEKVEHRRAKVSEQKKVSLLSKFETSIIDEVNTPRMILDESNSKKSLNYVKEDIHDSEFHSLIDKVDKKRQKLYFTRIDEIANTIVNDVMTKSKDIVLEEKDFESILNDWSECYSEDEKKKIIQCIHSNNFTTLAELLTSILIRDCLNVHDIILPESEIIVDSEHYTVELNQDIDNDDIDSFDGIDTILSHLENNYDNSHLGNIINKEHQCIHSSSVNSSSADVVENISFSLYRRISTNQLDYSEDEKELLVTAGDWLPKEEVIYSDTEQEEYSEVNNSRTDEHSTIQEILENDILSTKNIGFNTQMNS